MDAPAAGPATGVIPAQPQNCGQQFSEKTFLSGEAAARL